MAAVSIKERKRQNTKNIASGFRSKVYLFTTLPIESITVLPSDVHDPNFM